MSDCVFHLSNKMERFLMEFQPVQIYWHGIEPSVSLSLVTCRNLTPHWWAIKTWAVHLFRSAHNRYPIAHPGGWVMGWFLWVEVWIYGYCSTVYNTVFFYMASRRYHHEWTFPLAGVTIDCNALHNRLFRHHHYLQLDSESVFEDFLLNTLDGDMIWC